MPAKHTEKAFTLPELVIAVSITAVIALAVAGLAAALTHAHGTTDTMRESIQSARLAMMKMETALRTGKLVPSASAGRLVVWTGDENEDKQINVAEIVLFKHDAGDGTIQRRQVVFCPTMPPETREALNRSYTLEEVTDGADVEDELNRPEYASYLSAPVLATGVTGFEMGTDVDPPQSRLVLLQVAVGPADQHITLSNAVQLRADATGYVSKVQGSWVLNLP